MCDSVSESSRSFKHWHSYHFVYWGLASQANSVCVDFSLSIFSPSADKPVAPRISGREHCLEKKANGTYLKLLQKTLFFLVLFGFPF